MRFISDKHGEKYVVAIDDGDCSLNFRVFTTNPAIQKAWVGHANCSYQGNGILKLADICMKDKAVLIYHRTGLFWMFQKVKWEQKNFQQLGLGTELLKCVFAVAKKKGTDRIVGNIKGLDYPKNPHLTKWYADLGFTVTMEERLSASVATISKIL